MVSKKSSSALFQLPVVEAEEEKAVSEHKDNGHNHGVEQFVFHKEIEYVDDELGKSVARSHG